MAEFDHWLPLHVGDYLADTMHLTTLQHGIYIRLIMHYWKRHEALPADERVLAQIAGLSFQSFRRVCEPVMALFTLTDLSSQNGVRESRFSHRRLEGEIFKAKELSVVRSALGKKGSQTRWGKQQLKNENSKSHRFANSKSMASLSTGKSNPSKEDYSSHPQPQAADERVVRLDEGARAHPRPTDDEIQRRIQQDLQS